MVDFVVSLESSAHTRICCHVLSIPYTLSFLYHENFISRHHYAIHDRCKETKAQRLEPGLEAAHIGCLHAFLLLPFPCPIFSLTPIPASPKYLASWELIYDHWGTSQIQEGEVSGALGAVTHKTFYATLVCLLIYQHSIFFPVWIFIYFPILYIEYFCEIKRIPQLLWFS